MKRKFTVFLLAAAFALGSCGDPYTYTGPVHHNPQTDTTSVDPGPSDTTETPTPPAPVEVAIMDGFTEEFEARATENIVFSRYPSGPDFRYFSAFPSLTVTDKKVLLLRLNPADAAGSGPVVSTSGFVEEGSVCARLRLPDISSVQPKLSAFVELALCDTTGADALVLSLSLADPAKVTVTKGTDERVITPEVSGFKASSQFYTYGVDCSEGGLSCWIQAGATTEKKTLAEFTSDVPASPLRPVLRFFHKSPAALYPYELEVDMISYEPAG